MQPRLVSVMMPAYNAAAYVADAVRSVLAQTYQDWELLVVDDGSTDATAAVVAQFDDPRIRLLHKPNGGESTARNLALDRSSGEFVAYLDADDVWLPQHLAVTIAFLQAHPDRDAVYTDGFHIDQHGNRLAPLQSRRRGPFAGRLYEEVVRASDVFGPPMCVVVPRESVVEAHALRYDPRIVIGPDWDFFIRLADVATFGYLPEQTGLYRVHLTNITAQVGPSRRAGYLAICREKSINMQSFIACTVETRVAVLYDLLVNLLRTEPEKRSQVTKTAGFLGLPAPEQARLLRLMAADAILHCSWPAGVREWLARARALDPADPRVRLLAALHRVSPRLCRALLRGMRRWRGATGERLPFADLAGAPDAVASGPRAADPAAGG